MKKINLKRIATFGLALLLITVSSSCKKNKNTGPEPAPTSGMKGTIDGKTIAINETAITTTYYSSPGDNVNSLMTSAALDASGGKMVFFIPDISAATSSITPKLGTSSNPGNPNLKVQATGTATVQIYVAYTSGGNTYYAISGTVTVSYDDTKISVKWDISFKDATGRVFTSAGEFTIYFYKTVTKAKAEVTDPTPVAAKPTIDNIAPTSGAAGDEVAIAGTNFSVAATEDVVMFNGVAATVKTATATKLTVTAPTATTGAITVKVKNSDVTTGPVFTYVLPATFTALSPNIGKAGDAVTLTGTNFSTTLTDNVVTFNGTAATVKSATATALTVEVPQGVTTGLVAIKVKGKDAGVGVSFTPTFTVVISSAFGTPGQAYGLSTVYFGPSYKTYDNDGNLWVVDVNGQINKEAYTGGDQLKTIAPSFFNGIASLSSYQCVGLARDANGGIHAYIYGSATGGAGNPVFVATVSTPNPTRDFDTQFAEKSSGGFAMDALSNVFMLSTRYGTSDVIRLKSDGTNEIYLKGGTGADNTLGGANAYNMCYDGGYLYVLTYVTGSPNTNAAIYKFDSSKNRTLVATLPDGGYADGPIVSAKFNDVRSIAVNGSAIYIGDYGNGRIRKLDTRSNTVTTFAGSGTTGTTYSGDALTVNLTVGGLLVDGNHNVVYNFGAFTHTITRIAY